MPSIGSVSFKFIRGMPIYPGRQINKLPPRPGVDGDAFRLGGIHGMESSITGIQDLPEASVDAMKVTLNDLRGTKQTLIDDHGDTYNNVVILDVTITKEDEIAGIVGGLDPTSDRLLISTLRIHHTALPQG